MQFVAHRTAFCGNWCMSIGPIFKLGSCNEVGDAAINGPMPLIRTPCRACSWKFTHYIFIFWIIYKVVCVFFLLELHGRLRMTAGGKNGEFCLLEANCGPFHIAGGVSNFISSLSPLRVCMTLCGLDYRKHITFRSNSKVDKRLEIIREEELAFSWTFWSTARTFPVLRFI